MKISSTTKAALALAALVITLATPAAAYAAKPAGTSKGGSAPSVPTGNDVSWPQCGRRLPSGQAFGVVGVNDGLANTTNPCLATELAWANTSKGSTGQPKAALYVNTANPGDIKAQVTDWPSSGTSAKYGSCSGANDAACAYQYGWDRARQDTQDRGVTNPADYIWWLDVETANTWSASTANNAADLEGMVDYFQSLGARSGLYSTAYQWQQLTGNSVSSTSSLNGLDSWLAGASNLTNAQAQCASPALTSGGRVSLVQYVAQRTDYDVSCI